MIGLLQRVARAAVSVDGHTVGEIGPGLLVLVGVRRDDSETHADRLLERLLRRLLVLGQLLGHPVEGPGQPAQLVQILPTCLARHTHTLPVVAVGDVLLDAADRR